MKGLLCLKFVQKNKKTSRRFSTLLLFFQQSLHVKTEANGIRLCDSTLTKL